MDNIEKNHIYNGHYFVLGGYFPILNNNAGWVRTEELKKIIDKRKKELKEIIFDNRQVEESSKTFFNPKSPLDITLKEVGLNEKP